MQTNQLKNNSFLICFFYIHADLKFDSNIVKELDQLCRKGHIPIFFENLIFCHHSTQNQFVSHVLCDKAISNNVAYGSYSYPIIFVLFSKMSLYHLFHHFRSIVIYKIYFFEKIYCFKSFIHKIK